MEQQSFTQFLYDSFDFNVRTVMLPFMHNAESEKQKHYSRIG